MKFVVEVTAGDTIHIRSYKKYIFVGKIRNSHLLNDKTKSQVSLTV
jgi:hypothetical protein